MPVAASAPEGARLCAGRRFPSFHKVRNVCKKSESVDPHTILHLLVLKPQRAFLHERHLDSNVLLVTVTACRFHTVCLETGNLWFTIMLECLSVHFPPLQRPSGQQRSMTAPGQNRRSSEG